MMGGTWGPDAVQSILRNRGHLIVGEGDPRQILLPLQREPTLSGEEFNQFFDLFGRRSFRQVVRRIINGKGARIPISELEDMAGRFTPDYAQFLCSLGVIQSDDEGVTLTRIVDNIGPTLEWYVAELCRRELAGSSAWGVKLDDPPTGGDYDVLAWLPPTLLYVETKSSAPSQISESELTNFLQRGDELAADAALLLVDTESDMSDLLARLNDAMLPTIRKMNNRRDDDWRPEKPSIASQSSYPGIAFGMRRFYVTNAKPSIVKQLRRVLRHYNERVKGVAAWGIPPKNWVTGEVYKS